MAPTRPNSFNTTMARSYRYWKIIHSFPTMEFSSMTVDTRAIPFLLGRGQMTCALHCRTIDEMDTTSRLLLLWSKTITTTTTMEYGWNVETHERERHTIHDKNRHNRYGIVHYYSCICIPMHVHARSRVFLMYPNRVLNVLDGFLFRCCSVGVMINKVIHSSQHSSHM